MDFPSGYHKGWKPVTEIALPMSGQNQNSPLDAFVLRVNRCLENEPDESALLDDLRDAMTELVARDDWLDEAFTRPHPAYYQQYLLHADPSDRFSVVSFVWGPGQQTPIHDHTVWGVIGMLRGAEISQPYEIGDDGVPRESGAEVHLSPGDVELVSPRIGDIHRVRNALGDEVSISVHAYGANIGKVERHVFPPEGGEPKRFVSGYSNA